MNKILVTVIVTIFMFGLAFAEENENTDNEVDENSSLEVQRKIKSTPSSLKSKRGIANYGYANGLTFSLPAATPYAYTPYPKIHYSPYAKIPGLYKNYAAPGTTYALSHGGAAVHSYNVNYPKYNIISPKPVYRPAIIPQPAIVPQPAIISRPALTPIAPIAPLAPAPSVFIHSKPISPVSYPVYANRYPVFLQKPIVVQKPIVSVLPSAAFAPAIQFVPQAHPPPAHIHPVITSSYHPIAINPIRPQLIPQPSIPSPILVQPPQTTLISQDGWRPIFVNNQPSPIFPTGTATVNRPSIGLLPPYLSPATPIPPAPQPLPPASVSPSPSEGQPSFEVPKPPNNFYLTPTETQSAHLEQHAEFSNEELAQAQEQYQLQQEHEQHHQQEELHQHLHNLHQQQQHAQHLQQLQHHRNFYRSQNHNEITSLPNQGYETASNDGRYSGPSSYDVQLGSRGQFRK